MLAVSQVCTWHFSKINCLSGSLGELANLDLGPLFHARSKNQKTQNQTKPTKAGPPSNENKKRMICLDGHVDLFLIFLEASFGFLQSCPAADKGVSNRKWGGSRQWGAAQQQGGEGSSNQAGGHVGLPKVARPGSSEGAGMRSTSGRVARKWALLYALATEGIISLLVFVAWFQGIMEAT